MTTRTANQPPRNFRTSSCDPTNSARKSSGVSRTTMRSRKPTRHSNVFGCILRMPIPPWRCGFPNFCVNSSSANNASACSFLWSSASCLRSAAVISNGFFKFFEGWVFYLNESARLLFALVTRLHPLLCGSPLVGRQIVFLPSIVGVDLPDFHGRNRSHFHRPQRDNHRPIDDANVFAFTGKVQPLAQVLLRLGDGKSLHKVLLAAQ